MESQTEISFKILPSNAPCSERVEIIYLLFMEYLSLGPMTLEIRLFKSIIEAQHIYVATTFVSSPGWLRDGNYKFNFQPYFNSSSVVPFTQNFLLAFLRNVFLPNGTRG